MLAIRSIILLFVLFCWKTSEKFLLTTTFERKKQTNKAGLQEYFIRGTQFNARAIIDSETKSFTEEPIHEYFAQCRHHSSDFVHTL